MAIMILDTLSGWNVHTLMSYMRRRNLVGSRGPGQGPHRMDELAIEQSDIEREERRIAEQGVTNADGIMTV